MNAHQELPKIFISIPHECGYLSDKVATTTYVDPEVPISKALYTSLAQHGFRRSGNLVYRPRCQLCHACLPVRVAVDKFSPNRSQRRIRQRNRDLVVTQHGAGFVQEHFELYQAYQHIRHAHGGMDTDNPDQYCDFLFGDVGDTRLLEMRLAGDTDREDRLLAVAIYDILQDGVSAVYTFFDPSCGRRALGIYTVLQEIELTRRLGLPYLYLGYYIGESPKMNYKLNFRPLEAYRGGTWKTLHRQDV